jgi:3-methylcrotonyl-CoA carboxylase alpha subunit
MSRRPLRERYVLPGGRDAEADLALEGSRLRGRVTVGGAARDVDAEVARTADGTLVLRVGGRALHARVLRVGGRFLVSLAGRSFEVALAHGSGPGPAHAAVEPHAASPMTGLVAKVSVAPGQSVAAGAALFVVEAMKMEYVVRAPRDVRVEHVRRKAGEKVALGEVVVTFAEAT